MDVDVLLVDVPSGMCMTAHPFLTANAIACRPNTDLPLPFSPVTISLRVLLSCLIAFTIDAISRVCCVTSVLGRRKRFHPWLCLNASAARSASIASLERVSTSPTSVALSAVSSRRSGTSRALVLLSTTLLRIALSAAGSFLPAVAAPCRPPFPLNAKAPVPFLTLFVGLTAFFFGTDLAGFAATGVEVEKALLEVQGSASERVDIDTEDGLARHLKQIFDAIVQMRCYRSSLMS